MPNLSKWIEVQLKRDLRGDRVSMKRFVMILAILFLVGCTNEINLPFSLEVKELSDRECKNIPFEELELDFMLNLEESHRTGLYPAGSGLALNDLNNDGLIDIFLVNFDGLSSIFWNKGNMEFEKEDFPIKQGRNVNLIDFDGDKRIDIFLTVFNSSPVLFENRIINGKTVFKKTDKSFMEHSFSSDWGDIDLDGDLDLVVASYNQELKQTLNLTNISLNKYGVSIFINNEDIFDEIKLNNYSNALALSLFDVDNNGFLDIFVGNDFDTKDYFYLCGKKGCFKEDIFKITTTHTMSYDFGDVNNDGQEDVFSTDMKFYEPEILEAINMSSSEKKSKTTKDFIEVIRNVLNLNQNGNFLEDAEERGIAATGWSWSSKLSDINNDGFLDIYVVNGWIRNFFIEGKEDEELVEENFIFINNGSGFFENDVSLGLNSTKGGRGMSFADLDNDGDLDIVVNNLLSKASIFVNNECENDFIEFELIDKNSKNVYSIGSKVILNTSIGTLTRTVKVSSGYLSGDPYRLHFGLGKNTTIYSAKIVWPDGKFDVLTDIKKNVLVSIVR